MASEQEFIRLLNAHQKIVYKVCNLYMDTKTDREDLFQEISLQAWKSFGSFRGEAQFSTWLYRVALNTAITFFRKEKKQIQTSFSDVLPDVVNSEDNIEEQVKAMYKAIGNLNKIDKALVMLYLEDYSYIEIGEMLGISPNNVAVKMNRLKIKLKEETEKHYQF
ncbi:MAG: RNA polymerase sigma factor [Chitinophagaceae bacterium]